MSDFGDTLRHAAGYGRPPATAQPGSIGVGRGSACAWWRPPHAAQPTVTDQIRAGVRSHRDNLGMLAEGEAAAREVFGG